MGQNNVDISIKTAVDGQKELTEYQKELIKLGQASREVDEKVEKLAETMGDLVDAEKIKARLNETSAELEKTTEELEKSSIALQRSREEFLLFSEGADPKQLKEMSKAISDQEKELKKLEIAQEKARKKYVDTNDVLSKSSDNVKRLITDQDHYNKSLEDVRVGQEALNNEISKLKDVGEAYKKLGVKNLEKEIEELEGAYSTLKDSGKLSAAELRDAHQKLTDEVEKYKKSLNGTDQAYKNMKQGALQILPIAAALTKITKSAIDYEEAMADVKKVITATDEEFQALNNSLLEMSKTTPVSAKGLAEIAAAGAQLGVEVENLKEFVTITADMATAFGMTAEQAGNSVASLSNIFGIAINDTEALGDAINHLSNNSAAQASQIVDVLVKVGSTGKAIGLTTEQVAALSSTMISFGKTSDIAGTSINAMLSRLQMLDTLGTEGKKALDTIGVSAVEMSQRIREDAAGAVVYFLEQVDKIDPAAKANALTQIFGSGPQADVLLMASNVETLKQQLDLVGDSSKYLGSMQKESAERAKTTAAQLEILKNNIDVLSINLGSQLLPIVNKVAKGFVSITDAVAKFTEANPLITKLVFQVTLLMSASKLLGATFKLAGINGIKSLSSLKTGVIDLTTTMVGLGTQTKYTFKAFNTGAAGATKASVAAANASKLLHASLTRLVIPLYAINKAMEVLNAHWEAMEAKQAVADAHAKAMQMISDRADKMAEAQLRAALATGRLTDAQKESGLTAQQLVEDEEKLIEILNNLGVDHGLITTGISSNNRKLIQEFELLSNNAAASSKIIVQSFSSVLSEIKTPEEFQSLAATFNAMAENGKIAGDELNLFKDKLLELEQAVLLGTITDDEFKKKKEELITVINQQASSLATVSSELAKQIELINIQIQQDKKVTESLIKKLEAERDLAKAVGDTMRAEQLENQIKTARIGLMNREAGLIKESITLLRQELNALVARQKAGEKLTEQEKARIKALEAEIASLENEASALQTSAQAQERASQGVDKHTKSIKDLTSSIKDATSASNELSGALDKNTQSQRRTTTSTTETKERVVRTEHALRGMADAAMMSASAMKELNQHTGFMDANKYRKMRAAQNDIADQINRFQEFQKEISNMDGVTYKQLEAWERMAKGFHYVNEEAVEELRRNLDNMRKEVERQHKEIEDRNKALKNQLRDMNDQDENRSRQRQQMEALAEIQEEIDKAQEEGDRKKVEMLEEQLKLTKQIQLSQNLEVEKQQREKARKEVIELNSKSETNITLNGENVGNVNLDDPKTQEKLFKAFIDRLKRDQQRSTKNAAYGRANRTIR